MEEFDKILEEVIWASFCADGVKSIKEKTSGYIEIFLFLCSKGDFRKRSGFLNYFSPYSGGYDFNKVIKETIQYFKKSHNYKFSFAIFCIGLRNKDKELIESSAEVFKNNEIFKKWELGLKWVQENLSKIPNWYKKAAKILGKAIEVDEELKMEGKLIELYWKMTKIKEELFKLSEFLETYKEILDEKGKSSERLPKIWEFFLESREALKEPIKLYKETETKEEIVKKEFNEILEQFEKIKDYFYYKEDELREIYKDLFESDRHFVIFSGPPGTGKTAMAILIVASYLGIEFPSGKVKIKELLNDILNSDLFKNHAVVLRTKPEWTSPKDVIGYRDINGNFHKGALYDLLENASKNKDKPFFIILDEMNLSHPEHYLSDIISAMETGGIIQTDNGNLEYHGNIHILGTINNDETTQNLSPRLLSRAYMIEMRVDWDEVKKREEENKNIKILEEIDKILKKIGYGFGYRDIEECKNIVKDAKDMDNFLKNKLIPKLRGSDELNEVVEKIIGIVDEKFIKTKELLERKFEELKRKGFI